MPTAWTHFIEWFNNLNNVIEYVTQILQLKYKNRVV